MEPETKEPETKELETKEPETKEVQATKENPRVNENPKISFIGVVEKTRRFFLCSLPSNAIKRMPALPARYNCKIKDKMFRVVIFKGGQGKFADFQNKVFFQLRPDTVYGLKLELGKIRVELWT